MVRKIKCKFGRLSSPVPVRGGGTRYCKLKPKTKKGRSQDRRKKSSEYHERRYRKKKRAKR